jgi:hypothetical protein
MMKPKLCKAGIQLREQIDDLYLDRDRHSDGWIGDTRHSNRKSQHNPDKKTGIVRAIDIDVNLGAHPEEVFDLVEKIRKCAKRGDKRIAYIIHDGKISSPILNWKKRKYRGANPHRSHFHISFTTLGDNDGSWFDLEGERNERIKNDGGELGKDISSNRFGNLYGGGLGCGNGVKCCYCCRIAGHNQLS